MICTPCGVEVENGTSAIYGVEREGKMHFGWTCCHHPVGDAAVILGSSDCAAKWACDHPECIDDLINMLLSTEPHDHEVVANDIPV